MLWFSARKQPPTELPVVGVCDGAQAAPLRTPAGHKLLREYSSKMAVILARNAASNGQAKEAEIRLRAISVHSMSKSLWDNGSTSSWGSRRGSPLSSSFRETDSFDNGP
jgi:hypothetical protein